MQIAESGQVRTETAEDTREFGRWLGQCLEAGDVVILEGPLGAGKTTLTQGIAVGLGVHGRVTSPTFTIAREHRAPGRPTLIHVDAYRLLGGDEMALLDALDLDSELEESVIVAEWGGGLVEGLAEEYLLLSLDRTTALAEDPDSEARFISWRRVAPNVGG